MFILQHKVSIREQIPKLLEDNVKILTTPCIVTEVEKMGKFSLHCLINQDVSN